MGTKGTKEREEEEGDSKRGPERDMAKVCYVLVRKHCDETQCCVQRRYANQK